MNMGNIHLVTGYAGHEHVTAADQGAFNAALFGNRQIVLGKGNRFSASVVTVNKIRVLDGDIYMQGRYIRLNEGSYVDIAIENGTQGYKRNDLIVARYTKDEVSGVEDVNLVVIKGTNSTGTPVDPAHTIGNILENHAIVNDMPLYRVCLNGLNIDTLVPLFGVWEETLLSIDAAKQDKTNELAEETTVADGDFFPFYDSSVSGHRKMKWANIKAAFTNLFATKDHYHTLADLGAAASTHTHAATDINSGILPVTRGGTGVSSISALFSELGAAKASHNHTASDITSGVIPASRGGTGVASLSALETALGYARTELITYAGTGVAGAANPTTITCSIVPKVLMYIGYKSNDGSAFYRPLHNVSAEKMNDMLPVSLLTTAYTKGFGFGVEDGNHTLYGKRSSDSKTVSWYDAGDNDTDPDPSAQCNRAGYTYYFLAIG